MLGAGVLLAGMIAWIALRTPEKKHESDPQPPKTATPEASSAQPAAASKPTVVGTEADRACADWVLNQGGNVSLEANEGGVPLQNSSQLYGGFSFASDDGAFVEAVQKLTDSKNDLYAHKRFLLRHVNLWGRPVRDADLQHL
jgi:hypothetical protein